MCACVRGVSAGVMSRESAAVSGGPKVCPGSGPVAVSERQKLCVSRSPPPRSYQSAPSPSCVAPGKVLNLSVLQIPLLKMPLVLGLWGGFDATLKGPGVLSVPMSPVPLEHPKT